MRHLCLQLLTFQLTFFIMLIDLLGTQCLLSYYSYYLSFLFCYRYRSNLSLCCNLWLPTLYEHDKNPLGTFLYNMGRLPIIHLLISCNHRLNNNIYSCNSINYLYHSLESQKKMHKSTQTKSLFFNFGIYVGPEKPLAEIDLQISHIKLVM